jgi:hypothetical protein
VLGQGRQDHIPDDCRPLRARAQLRVVLVHGPDVTAGPKSGGREVGASSRTLARGFVASTGLGLRVSQRVRRGVPHGDRRHPGQLLPARTIGRRPGFVAPVAGPVPYGHIPFT